MKKHPVDDLFKRRLGELDKKPSSEAWLRIQQRTPSRHRGGGWVWYAAAGIAVALMAGYLVWQNDAADQLKQTGNSKVAVTEPKTKPVLPVPTDQPEKDSAAIQIAANPKEKTQKVSRDAVNDTEIAASVKPEKRSSYSTMEPKTEPVVAIVEKPSIINNPVQEEAITPSAPQEIKTLPDEPAVSQVNKPETEPTRIIVVAVETNANEAEYKPKTSRFSRVFRQLKNARAGERVDWDEVGFNPKTLVARVDDRLRNKDEKTEKDHPKEKTKL